MTWTQDQIDQTLRTIVEKSLHDRAFRALALKDSPGAVHAVSPTPLPTGFTVKFVDNAGADLTIVLPDATGAAREIDEEDLAGVAGGTIGAGALPTSNCGIYTQACTFNACSPLYTKKPNSPTLCPH